jgi:hypothetical protein
VDRGRRVGKQPFEGGRFASVAAEVAGVEQRPSVGLDQQGECVVCRVVGQVRGNREGPSVNGTWSCRCPASPRSPPLPQNCAARRMLAAPSPMNTGMSVGS